LRSYRQLLPRKIAGRNSKFDFFPYKFSKIVNEKITDAKNKERPVNALIGYL